MQVTNLTGSTEIEGTLAFAIATKSNGTVWAWGYNANGQLGNGNTFNSNAPVNAAGACVISDISA